MANAATKTRNPDKPWMVYGKPDGSRDKLFEPGWVGTPDEGEVERLQQALASDPDLAYWWGWRPGMKRRAVAAIERICMSGDPDNRAHNVRLVREAGRRAKAGNESSSAKVKKDTGLVSPRLGRPGIGGSKSEMLRMAASGMGVKSIAKALQAQGVKISGPTVAARLKELWGQLALPLGS